MDNLLSKSFLLGIIFSLGFTANAGFHIEPYLGRTVVGNWEMGAEDDKFAMTTFGSRFGYQSSGGFQIGGELHLGAGDIDRNNSNTDVVQSALGLYLGYQAKGGFRLYGTLLTSGFGFDNSSDTIYSGSGFKAGIGHKLTNWLALNVEYSKINYSHGKDDDTPRTQLAHNFKTDSISLVFSFPFNL